jgi:hypothetical protein
LRGYYLPEIYLRRAVLKTTYLATAYFIGIIFFSPLPTLAENTGAAPSGSAAGMPANEGKVLATLDAPGYTYMELANTEKRFWVAAPTMRVKVGDRVRFDQSLVMKNFNSKTHNRTFKEIIFANSATVIN